jgi:phospholipase C
MKRGLWDKGCSCLALAAVLQPGFVLAQSTKAGTVGGGVTIAPKSSDAVQKWVIAPGRERTLNDAAKLKLLRAHVKYVFVLFQENRSFDFYFGTYPGANGLFSKPATRTPGFVQPIVETDGSVGTISPFLIPMSIKDVHGKTVPLYPEDTDSVDHSHVALDRKINLQHGVTLSDQYALTEEHIMLKDGKPSGAPTLERKQMGELVMAHIDCNAAPVLWNYADRFTLFDDFHQTLIGPSTPNAIAMIAGQTGETQWVKHADESTKHFGSADGMGVPVVNDAFPYWGSQLDMGNDHQPEKPSSKKPQLNLTFATLPLSFMGSKVYATTKTDADPKKDLTDIEQDIKEIAGEGVKPTNWGWYQQGYDHESNDPAGKALHDGYVVHHNAPQYFGYVSNNPAVSKHLHGLTDFFTAMRNQALPQTGGVFYVRGGYGNIQGLTPVDPNPKLARVFDGNDDHPGYSDGQISAALIADEVNAIAASPYWKDSAILITYDETDGLYDHVPSVVRSYDSEGNPLDQGPRIPAIVISPYGVAHGVAHEPAEHSSIIKFIDRLFGMEPLADLPDEAQARIKGEKLFGQAHLGPADDHVDGVGNMLEAFDNDRLLGIKPILPASYAELPAKLVDTFPQFGGNGCEALHIVPADHGRPNPIPADFNPRPSSDPGVPTSGNWTP